MKINSQVSKGIFLTLASYSFYALAIFFMKILSLSPPSIVFIRNITGLLLFSPLFLWKKELLKTDKLSFHFLRAMLSLAAMYCSTYGINHLKLGDAIVLEQTAPFFIILILFLLKKEKIPLRSLAAMGIAFMGVVFIAAPEFAIFQFPALASLASGLLAALCFVTVERLVKTETSLATLFYFLLITSLMSVGPASFRWDEIDLSTQWPFLLLIGLFFALCQLLRNIALTFVGSSVVGSYSYCVPLFSLLLGGAFLEEEFTLNRIAGSLLILGSGVYIYYEKRRFSSDTISAKEFPLEE